MAALSPNQGARRTGAIYNPRMTFLEMLGAAERQNHSMLCVGLDPEPNKFPGKLKGDANKIYDFAPRLSTPRQTW
jgi:hypothetical protein